MTVLVPQVHKASVLSRLHPGKLLTIVLPVLATLIFSLPALAQQTITVKGHVISDAGQPIPLASITVKGSSNGTNSDDKGDFELSVASNATLVVSSVGFLSREVAVNGQTSLTVRLAPSADLDQVVVVGYGTQRKKDVTGSVVSVNERALREVPVANLQGALQGRAAGLEIQRTGTKPGAGAVIRIRGERSANGSNDPLLVLDGIPFEGGNLNDINPDDVASVEVLKDASATAIYGSRGANGVLLVSTKRGKTGEARMSYNGYYGLNKVRTRYNVFNPQEYQALRNISTHTGGYMPEEQKAIAAGTSTDWQDLMYEDGFMTDNNLSIMGGNNGRTWSLGGGYFKETGVLPSQDFKRYSLRATIDSRIGKRLKIGLNTMNNE